MLPSEPRLDRQARKQFVRVNTGEKPWKTKLNHENHPGNMKNHENWPGTMKNQPGTMENNENQPGTMRNQLGTWTIENQPETMTNH